MASPLHVHVLGAMPKGNVGTIAAQRALYEFLMDIIKSDLSVSTNDKETFKRYHPGFENKEVYDQLWSIIFKKYITNYIFWVTFTFLNLVIFMFISSFIRIGIKIPFKIKTINRIKKCDLLIDLNLEFLRGIPISLSPMLIKQKPRVIIIHKIFWSYRIFFNLWFNFIVKAAFKKRLIIGPASFGPFKELPFLVKQFIKFILNHFVDLKLVREPVSAKFLDEIGVKDYIVVTDIALTVKRNSFVNIKNRNSRFMIGVAPAIPKYILTKEEVENYIYAHAKCLDELVKRYNATIIFLPSSSDDVSVCKLIIAKMCNKDHVKTIITNDVDEYESWIRKLKLLITTKMHPSILAARNFIPFVTLIYDHKQIGILQQIGLKKFSLMINKVSYNNLMELINEAFLSLSKIEEILKLNIPLLQNKAIIKLNYVFLSLIKK